MTKTGKTGKTWKTWKTGKTGNCLIFNWKCNDFYENSFDFSFQLTQAVGKNLLNAYLPIVQKRKELTFTKDQRDFQLYRRSRYVEFNLLQDRGTLFGIQSKGRVESILMSMPPLVKWSYDWNPKKNSLESKLYEDFLIKKDWV